MRANKFFLILIFFCYSNLIFGIANNTITKSDSLSIQFTINNTTTEFKISLNKNQFIDFEGSKIFVNVSILCDTYYVSLAYCKDNKIFLIEDKTKNSNNDGIQIILYNSAGKNLFSYSLIINQIGKATYGFYIKNNKKNLEFIMDKYQQ